MADAASAEGDQANLLVMPTASASTPTRARYPWWAQRPAPATEKSTPKMSERNDVHKLGELALADAFHPDVVAWTCDTGMFVPRASIKSAIARIARDPDSWREVLTRLRPMSVGITGGADTQGCGWGFWWGFEWKSETGRQRKSQSGFEKMIRRAGGRYALCWSPEEAVEFVIREMGFEDRREEIMTRAFGPDSQVGKIRAKLAKRGAARANGTRSASPRKTAKAPWPPE